MSGRADTRAKAAQRAGQDRMRRAAEQLRAGEAADPASVREATARLLERLADRELDVYTHGDAANLADRILAGDPYRAAEGGVGALPQGYDNGQVPRRVGRDGG